MSMTNLQTGRSASFSLLIMGLLLLDTLQVMAQQNVTFHIQQQTKEPVDAATLIITDQKTGKVVANGLTEADGKLSYQLTDGSYQLYCGAIGCRDTTVLFSIPDNNDTYNIYLRPDGTELENVVITARKRRPLIKMESGKISISVAQSYLANLGNSLDVLRHTPSVRLDSKGNLSLSALGSVTVYVNGKRIRLQGEALTAYLRAIPSSNIASITTSTNPDASYDSEGASGIIDITLSEDSIFPPRMVFPSGTTCARVPISAWLTTSGHGSWASITVTTSDTTTWNMALTGYRTETVTSRRPTIPTSVTPTLADWLLSSSPANDTS